MAASLPSRCCIRNSFKSDLPACPQCQSELAYEDGNLFGCPECAQEWFLEQPVEIPEQSSVVKDSNGQPLQDGDTVTVIKD